MWSFEPTALGWLGVAFVAAIIEVSVPHFGSMFVSLGAVAGAATALLGYGVPVQFATFIVVMVASLAGLRSRLVGRLGGPGVPSRTEPLIGRHGIVTTDIDSTIGTGRITVGGEDWAARSHSPIAAGTKIKVIAADGIVLEVTRA
jgi:membrane protein implicated in regulation of membrane protease activity